MSDFNDTEEEMVTQPKRSLLRELLDWMMYIAVIVLMTWLIVTFVGVRTRVIGRSMETTLSSGDQLIVDKISYRFKQPKRYDIVVFPYKYEPKTHYIKRIIGLPGETVQVIDGYTYINGQVLKSDTYGVELMNNPGIADTPITLGEDEYFVLGDNRNHSADSREPSVGVLKGEDLTGKAWIRLYPFNKFGVIRHE